MPSPAATKKLLLGNYRSVSANTTLTVADHDTFFLCAAADLVLTLPPASEAIKGMRVSVITGVASASTGTSISPNSVDKIQGKGLTAADDKDLINSGASDAVGDTITLRCDGVDGWWVLGSLGTWAREA